MPFWSSSSLFELSKVWLILLILVTYSNFIAIRWWCPSQAMILSILHFVLMPTWLQMITASTQSTEDHAKQSWATSRSNDYLTGTLCFQLAWRKYCIDDRRLFIWRPDSIKILISDDDNEWAWMSEEEQTSEKTTSSLLNDFLTMSWFLCLIRMKRV